MMSNEGHEAKQIDIHMKQKSSSSSILAVKQQREYFYVLLR